MNDTTSEPIRPRLLGFTQFVEQAWIRYNREFRLLIGISAIASLMQIILQFLPATFAQKFYSQDHIAQLSPAAWTVFALAVVVGIVVTVWGSMALLFAVAKPTEATSVAEAFRRGGSYFWKYFTTSLLVSLIIIAGTVLLIIPGIYWAGIYGFSSYLVFKENLGNMTALRRSAELIKGYWWAVIGRQFLFGLCYGFGFAILTATLNQLASHFPGNMSLVVSGILNSILYVLILPMTTLFQAVIVDQLAGMKSAVPTASTSPDQA